MDMQLHKLFPVWNVIEVEFDKMQLEGSEKLHSFPEIICKIVQVK